MYNAHNLYAVWDLAIEDEIALDGKVAQFWSDVWPRLPQPGILCKQGKVWWKARTNFVALVGLFSAIERQIMSKSSSALLFIR